MFKRVSLFLIALLAAIPLSAQIVPYYGKNNVKYDTFDWKTYKTAHFEIYFYPEAGAQLQRVSSMAESAYDKLSAQLQHDIEFKIPLIFFKTQSEFEQVNYLQIQEGILGAAEPVYNRMAFAIDQPSDHLQSLITHELGHVFEFSMLFGGILSPIVRSSPPLWVMEGFADFGTGMWDPADLMVVRDAVLTERLPFISVERDMIYPGGTQELGRAPYNVGHAVFEFIHDKYGEAAIRQFWFYMKKATLLGTEEVIYSALGVKEEEFNEQFSAYLRERFKDYRDKQSPIDYGHEIQLPKKYRQVFSQAPSPNGQEFAILTSNYGDYEWDILKIDREGNVLNNITGGFTTSYDYLTTDSWRFEGRNIAWSSDGRYVAYFGRTGKRRSLFIVDSQKGHRIKKIKLDLDQAASPTIAPDGRTVIITGFKNAQPDLYAIDVETKKYRQVTNDILFEKTPMYAPDGKYIYYTSRINSRDQIMRLELSNPSKPEQLTFSDYDSTSPVYDARSNRVYYAADKTGAYNLYALDMNTGEKLQFTDVIGSNFSPAVFYEGEKKRVAFTTFFKGQYRLFIMDLPQPVAVIAKDSEPLAGETLRKTELASADDETGNSRELPAQGPVLSDFQPTKNLVVDEKKVKDKKLRLLVGGRPSVITGVSGDTFAVASGVVLQDILGDQEFRFYTSRIRGFQSYYAGYLNLGHRFQYLTDFIFNDDFFLTTVPNEIAVQTGFTTDIVRSRIYGGRILGQYPLSRYYRFELGAGVFDLSQQFFDDDVQNIYERFLRERGLEDFLSNGGYIPLSAAFVAETTRFREFGPLSGYTFRLSVDYSPPVKDTWVSRVIYEGDLRKYIRVTSRSLVAGRLRGFYTQGDDPVIFSYGGGLDIRGFDFREIAGQKGGIGNLEYRFPMFPNPRVPFLGQLRAKAFLDYFKIDYLNDALGNVSFPNFSTKHVDDRLFLLDFAEGAGSFGAGFTFYAGGLPLNFDFSKVFGKGRIADENGIVDLRQPLTGYTITDGIQFDFSIGYDF
jgi:Tol biopolymer transport system component